MASPIKSHTISTYDSRASLIISKDMHVAIFRDIVQKLMMNLRVTLSSDDTIRFKSVTVFRPEVQNLVKDKLGYSDGDELLVDLEFDYMKKCLELIFKDNLHIDTNERQISEGLFIFEGATFQLKSPVSKVSSLDLPPFPKEHPSITFETPGPWKRFCFPSSDQKSKK